MLALILVFGFSRPDAVGGDRGSPSAMYEYSMIFFLLGFYFAGDRRGSRAHAVRLAWTFRLAKHHLCGASYGAPVASHLFLRMHVG